MHQTAPTQPLTHEVHLEPLDEVWLDDVLNIEPLCHSHPWTRGHFTDSLKAGYQMRVLVADQTVLGYFVIMHCLDEAHLLNITVAPRYQRQGWAHLMLQAITLWARGLGIAHIWLEARRSNVRALRLYERHGFTSMGVRKNYYPAGIGSQIREDALVLRYEL